MSEWEGAIELIDLKMEHAGCLIIIGIKMIITIIIVAISKLPKKINVNNNYVYTSLMALGVNKELGHYNNYFLIGFNQQSFQIVK